MMEGGRGNTFKKDSLPFLKFDISRFVQKDLSITDAVKAQTNITYKTEPFQEFKLPRGWLTFHLQNAAEELNSELARMI